MRRLLLALTVTALAVAGCSAADPAPEPVPPTTASPGATADPAPEPPQASRTGGPRELTGIQVQVDGEPLGSTGGTVLTLSEDAGDVDYITITDLDTGTVTLAAEPVPGNRVNSARTTPDTYLVDACYVEQAGLTTSGQCVLSQYGADGAPGWQWVYFETDGDAYKGGGSAVDVQDGVVAVTYDDTVYAADVTTGEPLWTATLRGDIEPNTTTQDAGVFVLSSFDSPTYTGLDAATGRQLWQVTAGKSLADPLFTADTLLISGYPDDVTQHEWTYSLTDGALISDRIDPQDHTVAAAANGYLRATGDDIVMVDPAGNQLWSQPARGGWVGLEDTVYGTVGGQLVLLDAGTGTQLAYLDLPEDARNNDRPLPHYGAVLFWVGPGSHQTLAIS